VRLTRLARELFVVDLLIEAAGEDGRSTLVDIKRRIYDDIRNYIKAHSLPELVAVDDDELNLPCCNDYHCPCGNDNGNKR